MAPCLTFVIMGCQRRVAETSSAGLRSRCDPVTTDVSRRCRCADHRWLTRARPLWFSTLRGVILARHGIDTAETHLRLRVMLLVSARWAWRLLARAATVTQQSAFTTLLVLQDAKQQ